MKTKSKFIMSLLLFIVLVFSTSLFIYQNIITDVKNNSIEISKSFKEEQFKYIWSTLKSLEMQAEKNVTEISQNIENDILGLSHDELLLLQNDMSNGVHSQRLHEIVMKNIENRNLNGINNHRNGIVIMSNKGFMEDFNYRRAKLNSTEDNKFRSWEDSISNSYNQKLDKNAIDKLINRTSGIIAFESYDLIQNDDHIKIKELTYDSLLNVYLHEGIEGLRNYQIFVPYYITDVGDIFGEPDISQGVKRDNNKIIVAQEFNLYDQIQYSHDMMYDDSQINSITNEYDELLRLLYIFGIALIASVSILIFYLCTVYNYMVENEEIDDETDNETETDDETEKENNMIL